MVPMFVSQVQVAIALARKMWKESIVCIAKIHTMTCTRIMSMDVQVINKLHSLLTIGFDLN